MSNKRYVRTERLAMDILYWAWATKREVSVEKYVFIFPTVQIEPADAFFRWCISGHTMDKLVKDGKVIADVDASRYLVYFRPPDNLDAERQRYAAKNIAHWNELLWQADKRIAKSSARISVLERTIERTWNAWSNLSVQKRCDRWGAVSAKIQKYTTALRDERVALRNHIHTLQTLKRPTKEATRQWVVLKALKSD